MENLFVHLMLMSMQAYKSKHVSLFFFFFYSFVEKKEQGIIIVFQYQKIRQVKTTDIVSNLKFHSSIK